MQYMLWLFLQVLLCHMVIHSIHMFQYMLWLLLQVLLCHMVIHSIHVSCNTYCGYSCRCCCATWLFIASICFIRYMLWLFLQVLLCHMVIRSIHVSCNTCCGYCCRCCCATWLFVASMFHAIHVVVIPAGVAVPHGYSHSCHRWTELADNNILANTHLTKGRNETQKVPSPWAFWENQDGRSWRASSLC